MKRLQKTAKPENPLWPIGTKLKDVETGATLEVISHGDWDYMNGTKTIAKIIDIGKLNEMFPDEKNKVGDEVEIFDFDGGPESEQFEIIK
jgi:hypothetical protein